MDIITYCDDTEALINELKIKFPLFINTKDDDNPVFCIDKTPTVRNGNETLALIRIDESLYEDLASLESLRVLGTYDEVFADPDKKAIYDQVYVREYTYLNENGDEQTGMKPEKFGVFAD